MSFDPWRDTTFVPRDHPPIDLDNLVRPGDCACGHREFDHDDETDQCTECPKVGVMCLEFDPDGGDL